MTMAAVYVLEMGRHEEIADAFLAMVRLLVDRPDDAVVKLAQRDAGAVLEIWVHSTDLGKVIGKQGRTARSLRVLLQSIATASKLVIALDILDTRAIS
jgi:uncharacterized protein